MSLLCDGRVVGRVGVEQGGYAACGLYASGGLARLARMLRTR